MEWKCIGNIPGHLSIATSLTQVSSDFKYSEKVKNFIKENAIASVQELPFGG